MSHLDIYNENDILKINGIKIKLNQDIIFVKDIKAKIIEHLIEIQKDILKYFYNENREIEFENFTLKYSHNLNT